MTWRNAVSRVIPPWRAIGYQRERSLAPSSISNLQHWLRADQGAFVDAAASFSNSTTSYLGSSSADFIVSNQKGAFVNTALNFLSHTDDTNWAFGDVDFYICAWVYCGTAGSARVAIMRGTTLTVAATHSYAIYYDGTNRWAFRVSTGAAFGTIVANGFGAPTLNKWHFIEVKHDSVANQLGIAINGGAFETAAHSTGVQAQVGATNIIGQNVAGTAILDGGVQGLGIFGAIPNSTDRAFLYNSGGGQSYSDLSASFKTNNTLKAWYDMSEAVAGSRADQHGGTALAQTGTVNVTAGKIDHESFTICGWVYLNALALTQALFSKVGTGSSYAVRISSANQLTMLTAAAGTLAATTEPTVLVTGTWYFFCGQYDATMANQLAKISLNNGAFTTANRPGCGDCAEGPAMGRAANGTGTASLNGRLDSVGFWKRSLTASEITFLYAGGAGKIYDEIGIAATDGSALKTDLKGWWNLDEHAAGSNRIDANTSINHMADPGVGVTANAGIVDSEAGRAVRYGNAQRYDSTARYLSTTAAPLNVTGDFSACMWVNFGSLAATFSFLGRWLTTGNARQWLLRYNLGTTAVRLDISSNGTAVSSFDYTLLVPATSTWYFVAIRHNNGVNVQININQTGWQTFAYASGISTQATAQFRIDGEPGLTSYGTFRAAYAGYWARALTDTEVSTIYNNPYGTPYSDITVLGGLLGYWDLDEESGVCIDSHSTNDLTQTGTRLNGQGPQIVYSDAISLWDDQNNIANFTKSSFAGRPYWQEESGLAKKPTIVFDGTDDSLSAAGSQSFAGAFTVAWVGRQAISSTNDPIIGETNNDISLLSNTSLEVRASGVAISFAIASVGDVYRSFVVTRDGSNNVSVYINGSIAAASQVLAGTLNFTHVGTDGTNFYLGDISEIVTYSKTLTVNEITGLHNYFKQKYGL